VTITTTNWRAGLAALLATGVLLLGACSDGDDDATDDEGTEDQADDNAAADSGDSTDDGADSGEIPTPSVDPDAPAADSDFCQGAIAAMTASANPATADDDGGYAAAEALEAPDEIAEAWSNILAVLRGLRDLDTSDPAAAQQATEAFNEIQDDQAAVMEYLQNDCGISGGSESPDPTTGG